jgi:hypothetical protein
MPPWVIEELQQERARREEDERVRSQRIELPQTDAEDIAGHARDVARPAPAAVVVVSISPVLDGVIDL